ncbi:LPS export ABC transporter permease LptF [Acinetobacter sp. MD2(2019)]|uniref:LPS export ABC transporter permease LptF n=1 Tax=Acinetobacter sp. MD2(2019) TaxID=2605273 RepID=UPI002D1F6996|nr:LPS export ABC transporter permease LptF [Acinetobacter sp. MD2(2019)]MEB3753308.1 LPS export ABC transporter permease LptF [Acinetobacter sp. MD2(2019)]
MIIRRYLVKQVVETSLVVIALLTLIMMGGRLIKYFGIAAQGRLDAGVLFSIIGYRLPEFLTLIFPLGFFIGLMLVFGRLYIDHEMAVLNSSGLSRNRLARLLLPLTTCFLVIQLILMVWVSPWGLRQYEQLSSTQAVRTGFDLVRPKEFVGSGAYTIYASDLSEDRKNLKDIMFYQRADKEGKPNVVILAREAKRVDIPNDTASVVDLIDGRRYELYPGQPRYTLTEFKQYRLRIENNKDADVTGDQAESMRISQLWEKRSDPVVQSELGWRLFVPFAIVVALMLATALSEVNPRQGRYYRLLPAILIFASLIVALMAVKTRITRAELGIWAYPAILLIYAVVTLVFLRKPNLKAKLNLKLNK